VAGFVVILSGLPGAGKSTLSGRLGEDLGFVVVCRDRLKASSLTEIGAALEETNQGGLLGAAGDALVTHVAGCVLDAGQGVVIDNNFNWSWQIDTVREFVRERRSPAFEVQLWGDAEVLRDRWARREPDLAARPEMGAVLDSAYSRSKEFVLDASYTRVEIDTTDLTAIDIAYPGLLAQIQTLR
jgi:predicted kinase